MAASDAVALADVIAMSTRSPERYELARARLEHPMTALAAILGVLLLAPLVATIPPRIETALDAVGWVIWALFVAEYLVLLRLSLIHI